jgi:hypothetical protein
MPPRYFQQEFADLESAHEIRYFHVAASRSFEPARGRS